MGTYKFTFRTDSVAREFVHALTITCTRLCIYRSGRSVTVLDGSEYGQREEIYVTAWAYGARLG